MSETVCPSFLALAPLLSREPVWRPEIKCKVNVTNTRCLSQTELRPCTGEQQTYAFLVFIVASSYIGFLYRLRSLQAQVVAGLTTSDFSKNMQVSTQPPSAANLYLTGKGWHKSFPSRARTLSLTHTYTQNYVEMLAGREPGILKAS